MKTIWRSLSGAFRQFFGVGYRSRPRSQPVRWTLAERILLPLAMLLIVLPFGFSYLADQGLIHAAPRGGVSIVKSASPQQVIPGDRLTFTVHIANNTGAPITEVRVDDALPAAVVYASVTTTIPQATCAHTGNAVSCQKGVLSAGAAGTVTIVTTVSPTAGGNIDNSASLLWTGGQQETGAVSVPVVSPTSTATDTPVPPSSTAVPPSNTAIPASNTPVPASSPTGTTGTGPSPTPTFRPPPTFPPPSTPPTFTAVPSNTPVPGGPTNTPVAASNTPVAATDSPVPTNTTPAGVTNTPAPPSPATNTPGSGGGGGHGGGGGGGGGTGGLITGNVTLNGQPAAGAHVELRSSAGGTDVIIATGVTGSDGVYRFANKPASPVNAVYYIRYPGGAGGTLANWTTYGQTYAAGATLNFPTFDIAEAPITGPAAYSTLSLPITLSWSKRQGADNYIVRIYSGDKLVLDTNELGNVSTYMIPAGALGAGTYVAALNIRQANAGYGEAANRFTFTIVAAAPGGSTPAVPPPPPPPPPVSPAPGKTPVVPPAPPPPPPAQATVTQITLAANDVRIFKSISRSQVSPGETLRYTITILNAGTNAATNAQLIDNLPPGVLGDLTRSSSTAGSIDMKDQTFIANLGTIQPGQQILVILDTTVIAGLGAHLPNQARLVYNETPAGISSNTVDTIVAGALTPLPKTTVVALLTRVSTPITKVVATKAVPGAGKAQPTKAQANPTSAPTTVQGATTGSLPKTGGEFPLLGLLLGVAMLVTRQIRLRRAATTRDA